MAIKGLTLSATKNYVSTSDDARGEGGVPTPDATVFTLGAVDVFVTSHVFDSCLEFRAADDERGQTTQIHMNRMALERVRFGLRGWRNFKDAAGKEVEFTTTDRYLVGRAYKVASDDCLRQIPLPIIRELAGEVVDLSTVTEAEAGN